MEKSSRLDRQPPSGATEAERRAGFGLDRLFVAILRRGRGFQRVHQAPGDRRDLLHGLIEREKVAPAGFPLVAHLTHVLECGGEHFFIGGGRFEVEQRANVPAHGESIALDVGTRSGVLWQSGGAARLRGIMPIATSASRVALLAGAGGLVGRELLQLLLASPGYSAVHCLLRRAKPDTNAAVSPKLHELVVSFDALPQLPACDDVFVALGTTIKLAGSEAAFRRVDHDYVLAVARAGRQAGATRLGVVSALGADAKSRVFYNRVKGEMQSALSALGYQSVIIAQPSLLLGDREALGQPTRAGEVWARRVLGPVAGLIPASFRPVSARDVARTLLGATLVAGPGTTIVPSRDMHAAADV